MEEAWTGMEDPRSLFPTSVIPPLCDRKGQKINTQVEVCPWTVSPARESFVVFECLYTHTHTHTHTHNTHTHIHTYIHIYIYIHVYV